MIQMGHASALHHPPHLHLALLHRGTHRDVAGGHQRGDDHDVQ